MKEKSFIKYFLPNILFNCFETLIIILIGIIFNVNIIHILVILISFVLNKIIFGKSMHYKDWKLCLLWSIILFSSFYLLEKVDIKIAIFSTVNFVFFSQHSNIKDLDALFFWGGNKINIEVFDWVKYNQNNQKLNEYENILYKTDKKKYYIFVYRFREFKTYSQISDLMDIDIQRISEDINIMSHFIEYSIRLEKGE